MTDKIRDLKNALSATMGVDGDDDLIANIMLTLDKQKFLRYHNEETINLLSTSGRVLCAIIEDNSITQRALSIYLDLSETMIDKTVRALINSGLITKTKVNRKNIYKCAAEHIIKHPDIQHLVQAVHSVTSNQKTPKLVPKVGKDEIF